VLPVGTRVIFHSVTFDKDGSHSEKDDPATVLWACPLATGLTLIQPDCEFARPTEVHVTRLTVQTAEVSA
jgi:hypothetical protein